MHTLASQQQRKLGRVTESDRANMGEQGAGSNRIVEPNGIAPAGLPTNSSSQCYSTKMSEMLAFPNKTDR